MTVLADRVMQAGAVPGMTVPAGDVMQVPADRATTARAENVTRVQALRCHVQTYATNERMLSL